MVTPSQSVLILRFDTTFRFYAVVFFVYSFVYSFFRLFILVLPAALFLAVVSNMVRVRFVLADPLVFPILRYHSEALEKRDGWWL